MLKRCAAFVLLAGCAATAAAQLRTLPDDAKRAEIRHVREMIVELDGREARLAPGAQIRDGSNLIIVPTAIPAGATVKYLADPDGLVRRVWILTPQEAAQRDKR